MDTALVSCLLPINASYLGEPIAPCPLSGYRHQPSLLLTTTRGQRPFHLNLHVDDVGHTAAQKAQLHLLAGRLLRKEGQLDQAVHYLNEAKKLDPQSHESFLELGRTFLDRREYDRALERLNKSVELAPDEAMGYFYAGKVLKELKEYERAERMLRQASKLAPNNLRIHRQLGVLVTLNLVHGTREKKKAFT
jgi:tetratricopeptide (TPR) repeat protein